LDDGKEEYLVSILEELVTKVSIEMEEYSSTLPRTGQPDK